MYDRITVVDSVRGPQARGGGAGRAFAIRIRARLLSLTRPPVRVRSPFGRAIAGQRLWGRGPATAARVGARLLFLVHLAPSPSPTCNFATVGSGRADRGAAAGGKHPRCKPSDEAEDKREAVRRDMVNEASIGFWI